MIRLLNRDELSDFISRIKIGHRRNHLQSFLNGLNEFGNIFERRLVRLLNRDELSKIFFERRTERGRFFGGRRRMNSLKPFGDLRQVVELRQPHANHLQIFLNELRGVVDRSHCLGACRGRLADFVAQLLELNFHALMIFFDGLRGFNQSRAQTNRRQNCTSRSDNPAAKVFQLEERAQTHQRKKYRARISVFTAHVEASVPKLFRDCNIK